MKIKTKDTVKVITGKDKSKTGKVIKVFPKEGRAVVEGINIVKKHMKSKGEDKGGIVEVERSVDMSNLMIVCPKCKKSTRVGFEIKNGKKSRICKKCNESFE